MISHVSSPAQARRRLGPHLAGRLQSRREITISPQLTPRGPQTGEWGGALSRWGAARGGGDARARRGELQPRLALGWPVGRAHAARVGA